MIPNYKYKTVLCRYWENNGACPLGTRCHFAHGQHEIRKLNDFAAQVPMIKDPKTSSKGPNYNNFKTVKCKYYELNICKNGDNCTFAHGDEDLRPMGAMGGGGGGGGGFNQRPNSYMQNMQQAQPQQEMSQVDRVVKINQIKFIIMRLGELYKGNEQVELILNNALHLVNQEKMEASADELQQVIYNQNCSEQAKQAHSEIVEQARKYGMHLMSGMATQPTGNPGMNPGGFMGGGDMMNGGQQSFNGMMGGNVGGL